MEKLLRDLLETSTPSSYEEQVQNVVKDYTSKFSNTFSDNVNNLYSVINGKEDYKILLTSHSDEIGLVITNINSNGTCSVRRVGGINLGLYVGVVVNILHDNKIINGVMGVKKDVFNNKLTEDSLFIDLGVDSQKEAQKLVSIGDEVVLKENCFMLNEDRLVSKALDDKIGCYVITKTLEELSKRKIDKQVCSCNTVCEEVGLRGAFNASVNFKPNIAIIVDVTFTSDVTRNPNDMGHVALGLGPVICHGSIVHKKLNNDLTNTAKEFNIPVQYEVAMGSTGTDADRIHYTNTGVPVCLVSIPLRYMHSGVETCDLRDVNNSIKLLVEFITKINKI